MTQQQIDAIQKRKTEGFVAQLKSAGKTDETIKRAHAAYIQLDQRRMQKMASLHQAIVG